MTLTIVYDNNEHDPRLKTEWGFACLVEFGDHTILFDTGGDGSTLLGNIDKLGLDPRRIEAVVLSHIHGDHTGGLDDLLAMHNDVTVYVPRSFPDTFKMQVQAAGAELVEVSKPVEIVSGVNSTGEVKGGIIEQALVVTSAQGLVVPLPCGCAHPGIVRMVEQAQDVAKDDIYLVLGGFHLGGKSKAQDQPHRRPPLPPLSSPPMGGKEGGRVQKAAPCHCSGDKARELFAEEYGDDYVLNGVGWKMSIPQ